MKKELYERMLGGELEAHLAEEAASATAATGYSSKTVRSDSDEIELSVPRDRQIRFEPQLIGKHSRRLPEFNDSIMLLYAWGLSTRDIQAHIKQMYGMELRPV